MMSSIFGSWCFLTSWTCYLQDETSLIWISNGGEKRLKLATVSKIVPGQRTVTSLKFIISVLMQQQNCQSFV